MEIKKVTDSIAIYSDGKRLQVIHNLGDEFILDIDVKVETAWNIDKQAMEPFPSMESVFKVCGFCSKAGEGMPSCSLRNLMSILEVTRMICLDGGDNHGGK